MTSFSESVIEQPALAWLERAGWRVRNSAESGRGEPAVERDDWGRVGLAQRPRKSLLPLAFGNLRLKGAEKFIGRAA